MAVEQIDLDKLTDRLGEYADESVQAIKEATYLGCLRSLESLAKASPVDTGQYANSWDVIRDEETVMIGNFAPHAPIIEFGARPHTPPIAPLLAWAKRVLRDPSQPPGYSSEVWALAKGTQQKIAREGQRPLAILKNHQEIILNNIKEELRARG